MSRLAHALMKPLTFVGSHDEKRLRALVVGQFDALWRLLRRLGVAPADLDDEVQRVFLIVAHRLADIAPGKERAFALKTCIGVAANARRQRSLVSTDGDLETLAQQPHPEPRQDELLDDKRARDVLDQLLEQLSEEQRVVLVLAEVEGYSRREIATALGLPAGTVASRLRLANKRFHELVARWQAQKSAEFLDDNAGSPEQGLRNG